MSDDRIEQKILHILNIFPGISNTMLQNGLGPQVKPVLWRPVLEALKEQGFVEVQTVTATTPWGRSQQYSKISLTPSGVKEVAANMRRAWKEGVV